MFRYAPFLPEPCQWNRWNILEITQNESRWYCWWKKSCTTFRDPQLKPRAPNLTLFEDTVIKMDLCEWRKSCTTCQHVIQHWAWGYGGASSALGNVWLWRWYRISSTHRFTTVEEDKILPLWPQIPVMSTSKTYLWNPSIHMIPLK